MNIISTGACFFTGPSGFPPIVLNNSLSLGQLRRGKAHRRSGSKLGSHNLHSATASSVFTINVCFGAVCYFQLHPPAGDSVMGDAKGTSCRASGIVGADPVTTSTEQGV